MLRRQLADSFGTSSGTAESGQRSKDEKQDAELSATACQHSRLDSSVQPAASNRRAGSAEEGLDSFSTERMARSLRDEERLRQSTERRAQATQRTEMHFELLARETERLVKVVTQAVSALEGLAVDDQESPAASDSKAGRQRQERGELIQGMCQTLLASLQSMVRFPVLRLGGLDEDLDASEDEATTGAANAELAPAEVGIVQGSEDAVSDSVRVSLRKSG